MFASIVARTLELARRWWVRTALTYVASSLVAFLLVVGSLLNFLDDVASGDAEVSGGAIAAIFLSWFAGLWAQLATIRAASGRHGIGSALIGALPALLRSIPLLLFVTVLVGVVAAIDVYVALALVLVLLVPMLAAIADLSLKPRSFGMRACFLLGLGRLPRNLPAYAAAIVVIVGAGVAGAALAAMVLFLFTGHVDPARIADVGMAGAIAIQVLPSLLLAIVLSSLAVATHEELTTRTERSPWDDDDEDDEPVRPESDLSSVAQQLVGTAAVATRRMTLPPRAEQPGRVPGPGVLAVAGVDLPVGHATRHVEAATLELTVGDGAPGDHRHDAQLWVSRDPIPATPMLWKRLAAGFSETGLWPLALPDPPADTRTSSIVEVVAAPAWYEQDASREPDAQDDDAPVEDVLRSRLAESLDGTPLRSTDLLRSSHVARGELQAGTGRRTDALAFVFEQLGPTRLALAPARRPADVLHVLAWPGAASAGIPSDEFATILASWEERYAALLVGLDEHAMTLAVLRPPTTLDDAVEVVAEHHALCPDQAANWTDDLTAAQSLVDAPVWRLSWH